MEAQVGSCSIADFAQVAVSSQVQVVLEVDPAELSLMVFLRMELVEHVEDAIFFY